jgi:phage protein D
MGANLEHYAPRSVISINGQELTGDIVSVQLSQKLNAAAEATITVSDRFDMEKQEFTLLDKDMFKVGSDVEIKMGYADSLRKMMSGMITNLDPSFSAEGAPMVRITAKDPMHVITKKTAPEDRDAFNRKAAEGVTDSDIAKLIGDLIVEKSGANLSISVDATDVEYDKIQLQGETRFHDLLLERAKRIYYEFYIQDGVFSFVNPGISESEILTLQLGRDLVKFKPRIASAEVVTEVKVRSRNSATGEDIEGSAQSKDKNALLKLVGKFYEEVKEVQEEVTNIPVFSKKEADTIATARLNRAGGTLINGDGQTIGIPEIRPGVNIKIEKVGKWFSGKYYVEEATHSIDSNGYTTDFKVRRHLL